MKTSSTNKKVRELITLVKDRKLIPQAEFQRRLVWSRDDKNHFLDSVLSGYPFPEIYMADGNVDLESGEGTQLLVDGLQRVNTLIEYFEGSPILKLTTVPAYKDLPEAGKLQFLQYDVAVRDLGSIGRDQIVEVFRRLNATDYSLKDIEINNAIYAGEMKIFAEQIAQNVFFERHGTFNATDYKRMGDLRYVLSLISSMIQGYTNRDDALEEILARYNDDLPIATNLRNRLENIFGFIEECGFEPRSRVWKKADLFTLICELDSALNVTPIHLQPVDAVNSLETFYRAVDAGDEGPYAIYAKAALQASNDRINRMRRGLIIDGVLQGSPAEEISNDLDARGL